MIRVFRRLSAPYRSTLVTLALVNALAALAALGLPWLGGQLFGRVVSGGGAVAGVATLAWLVATLVLTAALTAAAAVMSATAGARILAGLRQLMFERIQRLPLAYHDARTKGDSMALLTYETLTLAQFLSSTLAATPARLLSVAGAVAAMFVLDARLALVVPLLIPAFYLIVKIIGRRLRALAFAMQEAESRVYALGEQALDMLPATKAFTREKHEAEQFRAATDRVAELSVSRGRASAVIDPLLSLAAAFGAILVIYLAGERVRHGILPTADLFSFLFYAMLLTRPVSALAHIYGDFQMARGSLSRLAAVLDEPLERSSGDVASTRRQARLSIRDLHFAFPGRLPLFEGLNLEIGPGERLALTGPNGSGKTALVNLMLHYYQPDSGAILLDGDDIAAMELTALRSHFGLVPQSPLLFDGSIRDNIAYGAEEASDEAVEAAARLAQAHDFIAALPHGYATAIGDRGVRLSGGQRQRLALARALIKNPPILILDEATSMFDRAGEEQFIADCAAAIAGRTVIFITHRPALLALATRRLTLEEGRIVEDQITNAGRARA